MGLKVLSLFDGISCGMVALERAGIQVDRYVAYEIDKYAIQVSRKNYPQIEQCGDVTTADFTQYEGFDLLIGGSPCQDLSVAKIGGKGLKGEKSSLFYHYLRALQECKPKYFLLENVASMKNEERDKISEFLGVQPVAINSNLVSALERNRYYWTNIPGITQPEDKGLFFSDVQETDVEERYFFTQKTYESMEKILQIEAERLQTLPDGYTDGISNTQRYKCLGNGWTVDVIAHILKGLCVCEDIANTKINASELIISSLTA